MPNKYSEFYRNNPTILPKPMSRSERRRLDALDREPPYERPNEAPSATPRNPSPDVDAGRFWDHVRKQRHNDPRS